MTELAAARFASKNAPTGGAPRHLGIVLDGNRRWARRRGLASVADGHRTGFAKIPEVLAWCAELGIEVVTVWMLSDDNIRHRTDNELADLYRIDEDIIARLTSASSPSATTPTRIRSCTTRAAPSEP
ncbi:undecaprenyl diphosphate synthase family protein [Kutzneria sp. NPDC052558]|uniref:undecaprenyl diphosphate synthase family protein n=1 Tax=Kutzneria sp. NPDC052558 TaxID=3364121 RepID=UPI0037C5C626